MMGSDNQWSINPCAEMAYTNYNFAQFMGLGGAYSNIHQQSLQGRNPYDSGYPPNSAQHMGGHPISYISGYPGHPGHPGMFISGHQQVNLLIYIIKPLVCLSVCVCVCYSTLSTSVGRFQNYLCLWSSHGTGEVKKNILEPIGA